MDFLDSILKAFWERPSYQRVFLAFTVGLFLSCAARVAQQTDDAGIGTASSVLAPR